MKTYEIEWEAIVRCWKTIEVPDEITNTVDAIRYAYNHDNRKDPEWQEPMDAQPMDAFRYRKGFEQ